MCYLTSLQELRILMCPYLYEKCQFKGEDCPKIVHIPKVTIQWCWSVYYLMKLGAPCLVSFSTFSFSLISWISWWFSALLFAFYNSEPCTSYFKRIYTCIFNTHLHIHAVKGIKTQQKVTKSEAILTYIRPFHTINSFKGPLAYPLLITILWCQLF